MMQLKRVINTGQHWLMEFNDGGGEVKQTHPVDRLRRPIDA